MKLKYDAISIMHAGAAALNKNAQSGTAFALYELANNMRLLMRCEATIEDWNEIYVGAEREPVDIDLALQEA